MRALAVSSDAVRCPKCGDNGTRTIAHTGTPPLRLVQCDKCGHISGRAA